MSNSTGLVILFREFRIHDNTVLDKAFLSNDKIIILFVFNPTQVKNTNKYFSQYSFDLLKQSVVYFNKLINDKLSIIDGKYEKILPKIFKKMTIDNLYYTRDYTPYSRIRADKITNVCKKYHVNVHEVIDHVLFFPDYGYRKYTPFLRLAKQHKVRNVSNYKINTKKIIKLKNHTTQILPKYVDLYVDVIKRLKLNYSKYNTLRDIPVLDGTTRLSHLLKFGILSIREFYHSVNNAIRRELYWRDFYYQVTWYFPHVLGGVLSNGTISHIGENLPLQDKYKNIHWCSINTEPGKTLWHAWTTGNTGYALVDAGIKQLLQTGWMHNRIRMVCASFLVKILLIDWRHGERFFAQHLIDYDPCQNNGGWQWCASTGADSQPYFRIFNPSNQLLSHDPNAEYVKKYIPKYKNLSVKEILTLDKIVDYSKQKTKAISLYKKY